MFAIVITAIANTIGIGLKGRPVRIGLGISFFAAEQWGLLGTASTVIGALLLAGGVIGLVEADFAGLAFFGAPFLRARSRDP